MNSKIFRCVLDIFTIGFKISPSVCSWIRIPSVLIHKMTMFLCGLIKKFHITLQKHFGHWATLQSKQSAACQPSCPVSISRHFQQQYANTHSALWSGNLLLTPNGIFLMTSCTWCLLLLSGFQQQTSLTVLLTSDLIRFLLCSGIAIENKASGNAQVSSVPCAYHARVNPTFNLHLILNTHFSHGLILAIYTSIGYSAVHP